MSQDKLIDQFLDNVPQQTLEKKLSPDMIEAVRAEVAALRAQLKDANERLSNPQGLQEFVCLEQMKSIPLLDIHRAHQALHENNAALTAKVDSLTAENEKLTAGDGYAKGAFDFARYLDGNNEAAEVAAKNSGFFQLVETFVVNAAIGTGK